jgi:ketosteroid isomerase-like protein
MRQLWITRAGSPEVLEFRLTMGVCKKDDGRWTVTHEHHSLPAV